MILRKTINMMTTKQQQAFDDGYKAGYIQDEC